MNRITGVGLVCAGVGTEADYLDWRIGSGKTVEIYDIAVTSERRKGIGRALVNRLLEELPQGTRMVWAITRADNYIAQCFYEELRFTVIGVLRNLYGDGSVAVVYGRELDSMA